MIPNTPTSSPFLRVQRKFPADSQMLVSELDRTYVDIANAVNNRIISTFSQGQNIVNGESWFIGGFEYRGFQRVYSLTGTGNTPHFLNLNNIYSFTSITGTFTDGTNIYPLPYVDSVSATNQVSVYLSPTNIVITAGGGSPPTFSSGIIILKWIVKV